MKQIIEKLKEKMGVAKNLHVQSGYPAQVHLSPDEARQIVEALEGKTKLPIIQRIQDRTTEEEKRLAEQIAEEAISKTETAETQTNWISVEDRLPTEKDADENGKVLVWREMNEGQAGLTKSILDWNMVKYCDKGSFWQPLPTPPKH